MGGLHLAAVPLCFRAFLLLLIADGGLCPSPNPTHRLGHPLKNNISRKNCIRDFLFRNHTRPSLSSMRFPSLGGLLSPSSSLFFWLPHVNNNTEKNHKNGPQQTHPKLDVDHQGQRGHGLDSAIVLSSFSSLSSTTTGKPSVSDEDHRPYIFIDTSERPNFEDIIRPVGMLPEVHIRPPPPPPPMGSFIDRQWCSRRTKEILNRHGCRCTGPTSFGVVICEAIHTRAGLRRAMWTISQVLSQFSPIAHMATQQQQEGHDNHESRRPGILLGKFIFQNSDRLYSIDRWDFLGGRPSSSRPMAAASWPRYRIIRIEKTPIRHLDLDTFRPSWDTLRRLEAIRNELEWFQWGKLVNFPRLEHLDLRYNSLSVIPEHGFPPHGTLRTVNLAFNRLDHIGSNAFYGLSNLELLDLKSNRLSVLGSFALAVPSAPAASRPSVDRVLDLSHNGLHTIVDSALAQQTPILLNLSHNKLKRIAQITFQPIVERMVRRWSSPNNSSAAHEHHANKNKRSGGGMISLEGNPLSCRCEDISWLVRLFLYQKWHLTGIWCPVRVAANSTASGPRPGPETKRKPLSLLTLEDLNCSSKRG